MEYTAEVSHRRVCAHAIYSGDEPAFDYAISAPLSCIGAVSYTHLTPHELCNIIFLWQYAGLVPTDASILSISVHFLRAYKPPLM